VVEKKEVTFKFPNGLKGWIELIKNIEPFTKLIRTVMMVIVMLVVINIRDVFINVDFGQELSGTIVWVFVLFSVMNWGFK